METPKNPEDKQSPLNNFIIHQRLNMLAHRVAVLEKRLDIHADEHPEQEVTVDTDTQDTVVLSSAEYARLQGIESYVATNDTVFAETVAGLELELRTVKELNARYEVEVGAYKSHIGDLSRIISEIDKEPVTKQPVDYSDDIGLINKSLMEEFRQLMGFTPAVVFGAVSTFPFSVKCSPNTSISFKTFREVDVYVQGLIAGKNLLMPTPPSGFVRPAPTTRWDSPSWNSQNVEPNGRGYSGGGGLFRPLGGDNGGGGGGGGYFNMDKDRIAQLEAELLLNVNENSQLKDNIAELQGRLLELSTTALSDLRQSITTLVNQFQKAAPQS